ncbi:hypothetical protein SRHO_G00173000 [Serrasalmus rhombeus]
MMLNAAREIDRRTARWDEAFRGMENLVLNNIDSRPAKVMVGEHVQMRGDMAGLGCTDGNREKWHTSRFQTLPP